MKNYLLAAGLLLGVNVQAQSSKADGQTPPLNSNAILLTTTDSPLVSLQHVAANAWSEGFAMDSLTDHVFRSRPTKRTFDAGVRYEFYETTFRVTARSIGTGTQLLITGWWRPWGEVHLQANTMGYYKGHSMAEYCFSLARRIAKRYPGGRIEFVEKNY